MEDAGDTRWIRSTLRLLFAGLAAITAYVYVHAKQQHSWLLPGAVFALGAVATLALQAELHGWLEPPRRHPQRQQEASWDCRTGEVFESWMSEYPLQLKYDPTSFRWSRTRPVFVRLEGGILSVWDTTARVPRKELWNESPLLLRTAPLTRQRLYDLEDVRLLPERLSRGKLWSSKYPICVSVSTCRSKPSLQQQEEEEEEEDQKAEEQRPGPSASSIQQTSPSPDLISAEVDTLEEAEARLLERLVSEEIVIDDEDEATLSDVVPPPETRDEPNESTLLLFARCSRQKEEWYRRLRRATAPSDDEETLGEYLMFLEPYMCCDAKPNQGLNALLGRMLYAVTHSPRLRASIKEVLQNKLEAFKMPALMERPIVGDLEFGETILEVQHMGSPTLDETGLWVDLEVSYRGVLRVSITTKLNLAQERAAEGIGAELEEEVEDNQDGEIRTRSGNWPSFLRKLCKNRYFSAALAALSNTNIVLSVEVQSVQGTLAVNLPPPPSDRLWLGFRRVPAIRLDAFPRVGARALRHSLICKLFELKLRSHLERVCVLPNMHGVLLSFMNESNHT